MPELPIEIWKLIIESYDMDMYKSCMLVNKLFNGIVKWIVDSLPDKVDIVFNSQMDYKESNVENLTLMYSFGAFTTCHYICLVEPYLTIYKHDILLQRNIFMCHNRVGLFLPIEFVLRNKSNVLNIRNLAKVENGCTKHSYYCH